jgi:hypothetical protein
MGSENNKIWGVLPLLTWMCSEEVWKPKANMAFHKCNTFSFCKERQVWQDSSRNCQECQKQFYKCALKNVAKQLKLKNSQEQFLKYFEGLPRLFIFMLQP